MFRNYLIIALRNIARHKLYSFINIAGLAVGLACVILIMLFVRDELSYDKWIPGSDNLYRVEVTYHVAGPLRHDRWRRPPCRCRWRCGTRFRKCAAPPAWLIRSMTMTRATGSFSEMSPWSIRISCRSFRCRWSRAIRAPCCRSRNRRDFRKRRRGNISATPIRSAKRLGHGAVAAAVTGHGLRQLHRAAEGHGRDARSAAQHPDRRRHADAHHLHRRPVGSRSPEQNWLSNNGLRLCDLAPGADPARCWPSSSPCWTVLSICRTFINVKIPGSQVLEPRLTPFSDAHLTTDRYGGDEAAGQLDHALWHGRDRASDPAGRLLQFHESGHGARHHAGARNLLAQMRRRHARPADRPVPGRVRADGLAGAGAGAGAGGSPAARLWQLPAGAARLHYLADWPLLLAFVGIAILAGLLGGLYPALVLSGFRPAAVLRANTSPAIPARARCAPAWWCCNSRSPSGWASPPGGVPADRLRAAHRSGLSPRQYRGHEHGAAVAGRASKAYAQTLARGPGILGVARSSFIAFSGDNDTVLPIQKPGDPQISVSHALRHHAGLFPALRHQDSGGPRSVRPRAADDEFYTLADREFRGAANEGHNVMVNAALARALGYAPARHHRQDFIFGKITYARGGRRRRHAGGGRAQARHADRL